MAIVTFILGNSGEGKSFSLKHLDPNLVGIININDKPLPFRGAHNFESRMYATDNPENIKKALRASKAPIIVIDDFQYVMGNEYIGGANQKFTGDAAFQRYNIMAYNFWSILNTAIREVSGDKRVYILSHVQEDNGRSKIKTIGKMIDDKIVPEGMVTIVLQTTIQDNKNFFMTRNNGFNTVKSPEDMFTSDLIPNDLNAVDDAICEYYNKPKNGAQANQQPEQA